MAVWIAPCSLVTRCRGSGSAYELAAGRPAREPMLMTLVSHYWDHSAFRSDHVPHKDSYPLETFRNPLLVSER